MTSPSAAQEQPEPPLPEELVSRLQALDIQALDEGSLRRALERHTPGYTLIRLTPAAARKWKARYRIMLATTFLDCQSAAEAYARALLALLAPDAATANPTTEQAPTDA